MTTCAPLAAMRRVLDQLAAAVDPHRVVGVRLIGLQQRELGVVAEVDALVAERAAQLEDPLDTADAQPLEVELGGDAQVQVEVVGVDVGEERPGVGPAVDLLQDRGLDLQEALGEQGFPDRVQDVAAGPDQVARLGVDRQVDVAGAHPRLLVGQPLPLVGQRAQALADQPPVGRRAASGCRSCCGPSCRSPRSRSPRSIAPVKSAVAPCRAANCPAAVALRPTSRAVGRTARRRSRGSAAPGRPPSPSVPSAAASACATVWLGG